MMASLYAAGRIPDDSDAFTNLVRIGAKTVVDSLMSQVGILSSSHVLAGRDFSMIVTSSTVISWKTSYLTRSRGSTLGGAEPEVRALMSSTFFVKKVWNEVAVKGQTLSWLFERIEFKIFHCSLESSLFSSILPGG